MSGRPALPPAEPMTGEEILAVVPDELLVLAWFVGIFWSLVGSILLTLWFAMRQHRARRLTSRTTGG
jgi:hypothetical protein